MSVGFPACRHRGAEVASGVYVCAHPQVFMPAGADLESCRTCAATGVFCDRDPIVPEKHVVRTADPTMRSRPWNFLKSMADFVADGCRTLTQDEYRERLMVCTHCDQRTDNTCAICGCYLSLKARGRACRCPQNKWPPLEK